MPDGECRVDLLKVPHHGSDRNLERGFFEQVVADRYVISSDGTDDNPSTATLDWIVETQGKRAITVYLTYADANGAKKHLAKLRKKAGMKFKVETHDPDDPSLTFDL